MMSSNKRQKVHEIRTAMEKGWDAVVELYKKDHEAHGVKISKSGYTALHVAVTEGENNSVEELVKSIREIQKNNYENYEADFRIQNQYGNTPLHLAASMGDVRMCKIIISDGENVHDHQLLAIENEKGETPIFRAALHGKKDAFLYLNSVLLKSTKNDPKEAITRCRRHNGDTILHSAIRGEYFDLAYQIICQYPEMANAVNKDGKTPLQFLATKPSAFRSASKFGSWKTIIYEFIPVEKLKGNLKPPPVQTSSGSPKDVDTHKDKYPENYTTLVGCCLLLGKLARVVATYYNTKADHDEENATASYKCTSQKGDEEKATEDKSAPDKKLFPENYEVFYNFLGLLHRALLVLTGRGLAWLTRLEKLKEKHIWSVQVLDELIKHNTKYDYEDAGASPYLEKEDVDELLGAIKPGLAWLTRLEKLKEKHIWSVQVLDELTKHNTKYDYEDAGASPYLEKEDVDELLGAIKPGLAWLTKLEKLKEKHIRSVQVLDELIKHNTKYDYEDAGASPYLEKEDVDELLGAIKPVELKESGKKTENTDHQNNKNPGKRETALLIASRNGITEMVSKILHKFPIAIHDRNEDRKNILLVALEHRQVEVFKFLMNKYAKNTSVLCKEDNDGNGALHIAAKKSDPVKQRPWPIPGDALQLQWEIKWFKFVQNSMPQNCSIRYNNEEKTPEEIFTEDNKELVKSGGEWMTKTAESCSVIAALIATVAFATSATLPGGTNDNGQPNLKGQPAFRVFAVMSLVALSFSVTSLVMLLAILTARFTQKDFGKVLPWKLLIGLTSLFLAIASMLVSFCAGHFFVLKETIQVAAFPVYALTCIPVSLFAAAQFPLYFDLMRATFGNPFAVNEETNMALNN